MGNCGCNNKDYFDISTMEVFPWEDAPALVARDDCGNFFAVGKPPYELSEEDREKLDALVIDGEGDMFLADDGTYKPVYTTEQTDQIVNVLNERIEQNTIAIVAETDRATAVEDALSERIDGNDSDISGLRADVDANATAIAAETDRATGVEGALSDRIGDVQSDLSAEIQRSTTADANHDERIDENAQSILDETQRATDVETSLSGRITTVASNLSTETARAEAAEVALGGRIDGVSEELDATNTKVSSLSTAVAQNTTDIATLNSQVADKADKTALDGLQETVSDLSDNVDAISEDLETLTTRVDDKADSSTVSQLATDVGQNTADIASLRNDLGTVSDNVSANTSGIAENVSAISALDNRTSVIEAVIPATATPTNPLADQEFVNSTVQNLAANRVTYNANGDGFPTKAALLAATTFYSRGEVYTPKEHDYTIVIADESAPAPFTGGQTRYEYSGTAWDYEYGLNQRPFTAAQNAAIDSGITSGKVSAYDAHIANKSNPHDVTAAQVGLGNVDNTSDANKPLSTAAQTALSGKVDKVTGKGLSTNDYTTDEKTKLGAIAAGAQVNVIEAIQKNGTTIAPTGKTVNIMVPTKTSELTNDSGFVSGVEGATTTTPGVVLLGAAGGAARYGQKGDVGLGNVDNTSDLNKPVSTAQQAALDAKANAEDTVNLTGNQTIAGTKTFGTIPVLPASNPTSDNQAARKAYVDAQVAGKANAADTVNLTGAQTVAGVKTFSSIPVLPASNPTNDNQAVRKAYVDTQVAGKANAADTVNLTGNQTIAGVKTFQSSPIVPVATASGNPLTKGVYDADKAYVEGYNTVTGIANIPVTKRSVLANLTSGGTLSLAGTLATGREMTIKARNTSSGQITIALNNNTTWESKKPDGTLVGSVNIPAGGSAEFNIWSLDKLIVKTDA